MCYQLYRKSDFLRLMSPKLNLIDTNSNLSIACTEIREHRTGLRVKTASSISHADLENNRAPEPTTQAM